jgi:hypothetical protein
MGIFFAARGDQMAPRFVSVPTQTQGHIVNSADVVPLVVAEVATGIIGSSVIDTSDSGSGTYRGIRYTGQGILPDFANGFSMLLRIVPRWTGFPVGNGATAGAGLMCASGAVSVPWMYYKIASTGAYGLRILGGDGNTFVNVNTAATWSATAGTVVDLVVTWDGTTDADKIIFYLDGSSVETETAAGISTYPNFPDGILSELITGFNHPNNIGGDFDMNEFVIWDSVIDPTSVLLTSGTGSLEGSDRTAFVDVAADDALASSGSKNKINIGQLG